MNYRALLSLSALFASIAASFAAEPPPPPGKNVKPLFDGKSLAGWEGSEKLWRVQDGTLTGGSLTETVKQNEFLATKAEFGNFILRLKIKLTGSEGFINSGVQIRSQRVPKSSEMAGYQCDFGDPTWWGSIYDESRRNKVMAQSDMKALEPVLKRNDWNDYVIRADGPRITTWINGVQGVDYTEADPKIVQTGKTGIQIHGGGKALVQVKEITVEELGRGVGFQPTREQNGKPAGRQDGDATRVGATEPATPGKASPLTPGEERAAFSLAPGFEMELVVSEDEAKGYGKFVAVQFDQKGRLWTMTALEYPVDANENATEAEALFARQARDKVLIYDLEDRGTNGRPPHYAREPTVFADGLAIPLGMLPYKDGCYVQHGHDLLLIHDTDADGRGDKRETILTGFGVQDSHLFPHQFTRAPGGWIWMAQGAFNYGKVVGRDGKTQQYDQTRMAKFRPDGSEFTITSNGPCNIWGLVINGEGETFIQEANDYGYPVMPFHEYANYPGCSNAQWKSYAPEFPGTAPEFKMGGTGLSGLALTDTQGAFPPEWSDVMLVANPITNRIQAIKMHRDATTGTGWRLEKLPDVVISGDSWFRPVGMTLGPDGCVYIVDWYNKIISHNEVPRTDPGRDKTRGRIWRLKGKTQSAFPVPDFSGLSEMDLVATLGSQSLAQSHLAWQTLTDRKQLAPETVVQLTQMTLPSSQPEDGEAGPASDAKAIQALWVLGYFKLVQKEVVARFRDHRNPRMRQEVIRVLGNDMGLAWTPAGSSEIIDGKARTLSSRATAGFLVPLLSDPSPVVRAEAIRTLANACAHDWTSAKREGPLSPSAMGLLLGFARAPLAGPTAPSTSHSKPIKVGAAYEREFERYLVRMLLEKIPEAVSTFLDSQLAESVGAENRMVGCLALPPKESAPRVAKLLPQLERAPNDEEILRLAEAPGDDAVHVALAALVHTAAGLEALLRQKTKFDASALAPLLTDSARQLLGKDMTLALRVISAFKLTALEPEVAHALGAPQSSAVRPTSPAPSKDSAAIGHETPEQSQRTSMTSRRKTAALPALLITLRDLGSTRADLFLPLAESSTDSAVRDAALACLATTPNTLLSLWPEMNAARRRSALDSLSRTQTGSKALVAAVNAGTIAQEELDSSTVERLQAVLGTHDPGLQSLLDQVAGFFHPALRLDGKDDSYHDAEISLAGAFTVETWVRLDPGIGNADGILGAPGVLDINFHDSRLRVWAGGGLGDVIIAKKPIAPETWTHLAVTRDAGGHFRLYLNGDLDQEDGKPDPRPYAGLRMGRTNAPQGTSGLFADYRVWKTCRTPEEIRGNFDRLATSAEALPGLTLGLGGTDWGPLHGTASIIRTSDFPALRSAGEAQALVEKLSRFKAIASTPGDAERGEAVFKGVCLNCHQLGGRGPMVGPALDGSGHREVESVLRAMLTPDAAVESGYRLFRVQTAEGELAEGFLVRQDDSSVVLRHPGGAERRFAAGELTRAGYTNRSVMSLMFPVTLESLPPQTVSDLFAYIKRLR